MFRMIEHAWGHKLSVFDETGAMLGIYGESSWICTYYLGDSFMLLPQQALQNEACATERPALVGNFNQALWWPALRISGLLYVWKGVRFLDVLLLLHLPTVLSGY